MLVFDAPTHTYRFNGQVVPGVTSILEPLTDFSFVKPDVMKAAQEFGTAVHLACELDDHGTLDTDDLDPALLPYLAGWRQFCHDYECHWVLIESRVHHRAMGYAGTLDRMGVVLGRQTVVDIKTSASLYPACGPQTAAYARALPKGETLDRAAVRLKANGSYEFKAYRDPADWPLFCSLLTVRRWCASHAVTPKFPEISHV